MKKIGLSILTLILLCSMLGAAMADSAQQIKKQSGSIPASGLNNDGVRFSKSISATEWENYFDITLEVTTSTKVEELFLPQDAAVVLVIDVSNTMNGNIGGGKSRYDAAMAAAETFIRGYQQDSDGKNASRTLGVVAFNTHATQIVGLSSCKTADQADSLISTMKTETDAILSATNYDISGDRYTNMEAGLGMARSMLRGQENKYIVFMSDGRPTTYSRTVGGATGYSPIDYEQDERKIGQDGIFYNQKQKTWINKGYWAGTNYSDKAATRAQNAAQAARDDGAKIFAVGTWLPTSTISSIASSNAATVDCYATGNYVIGNTNAEFQQWMTNKIGSGNGYYYDCNSAAELTDAFIAILTDIKKLNSTASEASWAVQDPMNNGTVNIEFKGLYNQNQQFLLNGTKLTGNSAVGGENEVNYANGRLNWNLSKSGYTQRTSGNTTHYDYKIRYRVRLQNENDGFVERKNVSTNGETTLKYQVRRNSELSEIKTLKVPVPQVEGYLAEMTFVKKSQQQPGLNAPGGTVNLKGAKFTLSHDPNCPVCMQAQNKLVTIKSQSAVSDENGAVRFAGIPSGHSYKLTETSAPDGHTKDESVYDVTVSYDELTKNTVPEGGVINKQQIKPTVWQPVAVKYVDNAQTTVADEFSFTLIDHNDGDKTYTVKNNADGEVLFREFTYDQPGKYTYTIREEKGDNEFVDYDPTEFKVTVTVDGEDEGSGSQPGAFRLFLKDVQVSGGATNMAVFSNIYLKDVRLTKESADFMDAMKDAEFTLSHTQACCGEEIAAQTVTTGEDGSCLFEKLQVTHSYVLKETGVPKNYLDPDTTWTISFKQMAHGVYNLLVNGGNGVEGQLVVDTGANGTNELHLMALNTEKYPAIELKLGAKKLHNKLVPPQNMEFQFRLYAAEEKPVPSDTFDRDEYLAGLRLLEEKTNDRSEINFSSVLRYTHRDIYEDTGKEFYYVMSECLTKDYQIVYDKTLYLIVVRIHAAGGSDTTQGELTPEIACYALDETGGLDLGHMERANKYYEKATGKVLNVPTAVFCNASLPETGDDSRMMLYAMLLAVSVCGLTILTARKKRKDI